MSKPECPFNHELLVAYATGNVELHDRTIVEQHLAQCPLCRQEVVQLEKTWWVLDVWQEDVHNVPLRLDDLRRRLAVSQKSNPFWLRLSDGIQYYFFSIRLGPASAVAGILVAFLAYPWFHTILSDHNPISPGSIVADKKGPDFAMNNPVPKAKNEDSVDERFQKALEQTERDKRNLESLTYFGKGGRLQLTKLGFIPNDNVISANDTEVSNQPVPVFHIVERLRLDH